MQFNNNMGDDAAPFVVDEVREPTILSFPASLT